MAQDLTRSADHAVTRGDLPERPAAREGSGAVCSVLYREPVPAGAVERTAPACFPDLNLDQVVAAITRGRDEYDLAPIFHTRLADVDAVAYRHEVLRDLENEELVDALVSFASAMQRVRRRLRLATKLRYHYEQRSWLLQAAQDYIDAVIRLREQLKAWELRSRGLLAIRAHLGDYTVSRHFTALAADTRDVQDQLATVTYCVHMSGLTITVTPYDGQADYSAQVAATFERFERGAVDDHLAYLPDSGGLNHVEAEILDRVARLFPTVFAALDRYSERHAGFLDETLTTFDREIQFYLAYLAFIAPLRQAGLEFCYPQISDRSKQIVARDTFDLALADKLASDRTPVVTNDIHLSDPERLIVITGANQGGKTTLARTFGQLHHLAGIGGLVPGREAHLLLCDQVFTHFTRQERLADLRGRLKDDLVRIHEILERATPRSVVIMNEALSSTTLTDARRIGTEILRRIAKLDLLCVYVTFIDELSSLDDTTVSMVATVDSADPTIRTFKVERRPADGDAHALAIARKYRLTYEHLTERIGA